MHTFLPCFFIESTVVLRNHNSCPCLGWIPQHSGSATQVQGQVLWKEPGQRTKSQLFQKFLSVWPQPSYFIFGATSLIISKGPSKSEILCLYVSVTWSRLENVRVKCIGWHQHLFNVCHMTGARVGTRVIPRNWIHKVSICRKLHFRVGDRQQINEWVNNRLRTSFCAKWLLRGQDYNQKFPTGFGSREV